jgi:hypothetical protein
MVTRESSRLPSAEQRLKELGLNLPTPPQPFGIYAEAAQTGNLLFSERDASHGRPRSEIHRASVRNSMWKRGARRLASQQRI